MMVFGSLVIVGGVLAMEAIQRDLLHLRSLLPGLFVTLADKIFPRILPTLPTALFCVALVGVDTTVCLGTYVRAHQRDPFLPFNLISSTLISVLVWFGALKYGPTGAASALLIGVGLTSLPFHLLVWHRTRAGHLPAQ
jgi:hypothetical protein